MRTRIARAAIAAIALAMAGGASLAAATHAAAATKNHHTCTILIFAPPVYGPIGIVVGQTLVGTGCDIKGTGAGVRPGTVTGQVVGWANPRTFSYSSSLCEKSLVTCTFYDPTLLPKS
jgi:hypothetical protein